eukprot:gnl/TRDRNA2_/TRDRNA2_38762_c0_seq1.p1 gnl/TRDRNA2_/TRDRNA2_38762_c0~~gnl/TRDRNA2_/TRDRNA2_38762_c0_seq1.p1  ORF type:complete len:269 (+),score=20.84 gnl/TRDRNA2_/TRDRNA2_38762_c0_seq1:86-892(+)
MCGKCAWLPWAATFVFVLGAIGLLTSAIGANEIMEDIDILFPSNEHENPYLDDETPRSVKIGMLVGEMAMGNVLNLVSLLAVYLCRYEYYHRQKKEISDSCIHGLVRCAINPCTLCLLRTLTWLAFLASFLVHSVLLLVTVMIAIANAGCSHGLEARDELQKFADTLRELNETTNGSIEGGMATDPLSGTFSDLHVEEFCEFSQTAMQGSFMILGGCLMLVLSHAFMAAILQGEKVRAEEQGYMAMGSRGLRTEQVDESEEEDVEVSD